jgi:hypothetical protein
MAEEEKKNTYLSRDLIEYYCTIKLVGNNHVAKDKEDYVKKVKEQFYNDFNIRLEDKEIQNIQESGSVL